MSTFCKITNQTRVIQITRDIFGDTGRTVFRGPVHEFSRDGFDMLGVGLQQGEINTHFMLSHPALDAANRDSRWRFKGSWWQLDLHRDRARLQRWNWKKARVFTHKTYPPLIFNLLQMDDVPLELILKLVQFLSNPATYTDRGVAHCQCPGQSDGGISQEHYPDLTLNRAVLVRLQGGALQVWAGSCFSQVTADNKRPDVKLLVDGRTIPPQTSVPIWPEPRDQRVDWESCQLGDPQREAI
jgi:hypothetical protein